MRQPCENFTITQNGSRRSIVAFFPYEDEPIQQANSESHPHFEQILRGLQDRDPDVIDLFDVEACINRKFQQLSDRISVQGGKVFRDLVPVNETIADHILRCVDEGLDSYKPLVMFMERIEANPSEHSRANLYDWLRGSGDFTITDEGKIVAYKGVRQNGNFYHSVHAGPAVVDGEQHTDGYVPNKPGSVIQMPRNKVTADPNQHCAAGLHVGSWEYAKNFGTVVMEVEVDPADVVSVPNDHSCTKMRVWRYKVVDVKGNPYNVPVKPAEDYSRYENEDEYDDFYDEELEEDDYF